MMNNITETVEEYLAEHPESDFITLQAHFGTPQQIASAFVDEMETAELLSSIRIRKKIIKIILICLATVVAIWAVAVLVLWIIGITNTLGHMVVDPPILN